MNGLLKMMLRLKMETDGRQFYTKCSGRRILTPSFFINSNVFLQHCFATIWHRICFKNILLSLAMIALLML
jgi:hypothetical protein